MTLLRKLYKHQIDALKYTMRVDHPALFMEMRLGKTLVVIRRVKSYGIRYPKILVVAPNSALGSWAEELKMEMGRFVWLSGSTNLKKSFLRLSKANWYLINKESHLQLPELSQLSWDVLVLDESTFIKNPKAKVTRYFLQNFRDVPHRWILTGMPNPENDLEFVSQMLFLNDRFCGSNNYWEFRAKYFEPGGFHGHHWKPKSGTKEIMKNELKKTTFQLKRSEVNLGQKKIYENRFIEFPPEIREKYNKAENEFILDMQGGRLRRKNKSTIWATTRYIWMRQLCGGFLGKEYVWDGKMLELKNLLTGELKNEQVIIWFFLNPEITQALKILNKESVAIMRGDTKLEFREMYRKDFQKGKIRLLLIQQAIAQTGMNLSAADTGIYYSLPPGLFAKKQTEDRNNTLDKKQPLLYINLLVPNSVDVDIQNALKIKSMKSSLMFSEQLKENMRRRHNEI